MSAPRAEDLSVVDNLSQSTDTGPDFSQWSWLRKEYHFWILIIWGTLAAASVNWSGPIWVSYNP
jgi:hypothetical protein